METDYSLDFYRKYFYGFEHQNWFQFIKDSNLLIGFSLRKEKQNFFRLILRTNKSLNSFKGILKTSEKMSLKMIFELIFPKTIPLNGFRLGFNTKSDEILLKLDELLYNKCYKIGILYCNERQETEEEFYNNFQINDKQFNDFLQTIGQRIRLKDYKGFNGLIYF